MASLTLMDEMYKDLLVLYPNPPGTKSQSIQDLLQRFYRDHPEAYPRESNDWDKYIRASGAVGKSQADAEYDFWKNDRYGAITLPPVGTPDPGLGVTLQTAEAVYKAEKYNPACKDLLRDLTGRGHHMRLGSQGRVDVMDGALVLPGLANNYAQIPDHASLDVVGNFELVVKIAADFLAPTNSSTIFSRWATAQKSIVLLWSADGSGKLQLGVSSDGTAQRDFFSSVALSTVAVQGTHIFVKVEFTRDNGAAGSNVVFSTSSDGITYTPLGTTVTVAGTTGAFAGTSDVQLGMLHGSSGSVWSGKIYRVTLKNGIGGAAVIDADFSTQKDGIPYFDEATGKRVTLQPLRTTVVDGVCYVAGLTSQYPVITNGASLDNVRDIRVAASLPNWGATANTLISKWREPSPCSWFLRTENGELKFYWSTGGTTATMIIVGSVGAALAGSGDIAVRVFINVDNGSGQRVITFYKKVGSRDLSDAGWTQIGAPIVTAGVTTIAVTTTNILLGAFDQSQGATAGKWYGVLCKEINTGTVLNLDFSTWGNGDGMGGYPKHDANFRCVGIPSDVTGNDTNDTKWLDFVPGGNSAYPNKEKGWWAPGTLNNYAWVPDAAEFDIVGDLVLDADVALENWLTPSNSCLIGKWGVAGQRSYQLVVNTTGFLVLNWSPDGTTLVTATSTIPVGTINGQRMGVRASLDVSNGSSVWEVKFYTSRDYVNWSPLGASVLGAVPTSIFVSTQVVEIGSQQTGSANYATGRFFRAEIWNALPLGSNPPTPNRVLRVDFESAVEPFATFAAMGGQVVTLSRNPNGRKAVIVDRPMFVIGTDDYMECADHAQFDFAAANAFSVALALRGFNLTSALEQVFAAKSAGLAAQGWKLYKNSAGGANNTAFNIHDGVVGSYSGSKSSIDGTMLEVVGVRDTTLDKQRIFWDKVAGADGTDSTTATLANAEAVRIGRYSGAVTNYGEFELVGAAIWRKALTQAEVTALDTEFGTNV